MRPSGLVVPEHFEEARSEDRSPSYPFPRMGRRKLRPEPLSAFSTDTTIRSTCRFSDTDEDDTSETSSSDRDDKCSERVEARTARVNNNLLSSRGGDRLSSRPSEESRADARITGEQPARLHLCASDDSSILQECHISPLSLEHTVEPPSPLSPFGHFALFDALFPLPTPRFEGAAEPHDDDVSALVMERFENQGGFPWFPIEGSASTTEARPSGVTKEGSANLDTPPSSHPTSPNFGSSAEHASMGALPPSRQDEPCSPPIPRTSILAIGDAPSTSRASNHCTEGGPLRRLRRSTATLTSKAPPIVPKPPLTRGRSASLPVATTTVPNVGDCTVARTSKTSSAGSLKRSCASLKRSWSLSRTKKTRKRSETRAEASVSPPVVPPPRRRPSLEDAKVEENDRIRTAGGCPQPCRSAVTTPVPTTGYSTPRPSADSHASPPAMDQCRSCLTLNARLLSEQARCRVLEAEVFRLRRAIGILISPS
ncbi:hypothetical protein JCM3766R1_002341 [Sporobolomyces carnicolor]